MIKLDTQDATRLLVVLAGMMGNQDTAGRHAVDVSLVASARRWTRDHLGTELAQWLGGQPTDIILGDIDYQALTDTLLLGVLEGSTGAGDKPLIDEIVALVGTSPYGANKLNGEVLSALRRALLRPSETEKFRQLARESFSCSHCSHKFTNNEVGVIRRENDNNVVIRCVKCAAVQAAPCKHCGTSTPINSTAMTNISAHLQSADCGCSTRKKKDPVLADHLTPRPARSREDRVQATLQESIRAAARRRDIATPPPNRPPQAVMPDANWIQHVFNPGVDNVPGPTTARLMTLDDETPTRPRLTLDRVDQNGDPLDADQ